MPKKISDFGITMREACENTKKLGDEFSRIKKMKEDEKAELQDESDIICHYYTGHLGPCPGAMGDERSYVIKNGKLVMAHKRCQQKNQEGERKTPTVIIR